MKAQSYLPDFEYKIYPGSETLAIKKRASSPNKSSSDLFLETLMSRKSIRSFSPAGISNKTLVRLLELSFGFRYRDDSGLPFRTYPSAGARYPIEVYAVVLRGNEMAEGVYHYNVHDNTLELLKEGDKSAIVSEFYSNQDSLDIASAPCLILFSMVYRRTMDKYGEKGYRFILLDAGHMG